jgi:hypothetical protein
MLIIKNGEVLKQHKLKKNPNKRVTCIYCLSDSSVSRCQLTQLSIFPRTSFTRLIPTRKAAKVIFMLIPCSEAKCRVRRDDMTRQKISNFLAVRRSTAKEWRFKWNSPNAQKIPCLALNCSVSTNSYIHRQGLKPAIDCTYTQLAFPKCEKMSLLLVHCWDIMCDTAHVLRDSAESFVQRWQTDWASNSTFFLRIIATLQPLKNFRLLCKTRIYYVDQKSTRHALRTRTPIHVDIYASGWSQEMWKLRLYMIMRKTDTMTFVPSLLSVNPESIRIKV